MEREIETIIEKLIGFGRTEGLTDKLNVYYACGQLNEEKYVELMTAADPEFERVDFEQEANRKYNDALSVLTDGETMSFEELQEWAADTRGKIDELLKYAASDAELSVKVMDLQRRYIPKTYAEGDVVVYDGILYRCVIDNTVHSPEERASAWEEIADLTIERPIKGVRQ